LQQLDAAVLVWLYFRENYKEKTTCHVIKEMKDGHDLLTSPDADGLGR